MAVVLVLHGLLLAAAWFARVKLPHHDEEAITVAILSDPSPVREDKPRSPLPARLVAPMPVAIVDQVPEIEIPVIEAASAASPLVQVASAAPSVTAPEILGNELTVQCPERTPPRYPPLAKRQREQGEVRLRVELDESGRIDHVSIVSSSGSARLDEAARAAVESWRCRPAERGGRPVRAVALQSLAFVIKQK
jgi:protein TonB